MSFVSNNFKSGIEYNKNFKKSAINIPGLDNFESSSDESMADSSFLKKRKICTPSVSDNNGSPEDEEYVPNYAAETVPDAVKYTPSVISPKYNNGDEQKDTSKKHEPRSPTPEIKTKKTSENVPNIQKKEKSAPKRRSSVLNPSAVSKKKVETTIVKHNSQNTQSSANTSSSQQSTPNVVSTTTTSTSYIEIKDDTIFVVKPHKKNSYDINLNIPLKYFKSIMPVFNKGIKVDIFYNADKEKCNTIWSNISIKHSDNLKFPIAIYKIVNIDDKIINNLNVSMNNCNKSKEYVLSNKSDKNYKIFEESGIICIGCENNDGDMATDKDIYITARLELKKNTTYVFNTSINVIFSRFYLNIQNEYYKCSLNSREDNKYLICLVIVAMENHIIENGVKLMHYIN